VKKYSAKGAQQPDGSPLLNRMTDNLISAGAKKRPGVKSFFYSWAPIIIYCLLIFLQSSYPSLEQTPDLPYMDKILHGGAYALLGFLFFRALRTMRIGNRILLLIFISSLLSTLYGVSDEIHQHFVPSRDADIMDVVADLTGSAMGACGAWLIYKTMH
jgi:VanZ family protein